MARWRSVSRALARTVAVWLAATATLAVLAAVLPGFRLGTGPGPGPVGPLTAAGTAAAFTGVLGAVLWPLVVRALLLVPALVLALLVFALDGAVVFLALELVPEGPGGVTLSTAAVVAAALSATTSAVRGALAARDDEAYRRRLARLAGRRAGRRIRAGAHLPGEPPGVVFLQLDGVGHDVLVRALRDGAMPTLAGWLSSGSHLLTPWRTDWSSQTGASQLGILHGDNHDVPAFRWYEKDTGRLMVCNHPSSAAELERRRADRPGLLAGDGASRGNLFSGGAGQSALVLSVSGRSVRRDRSGYFAYFADPANALRTLGSLLAEVGRELVQAARQRLRDVRPRVRRGGLYPLVRAFATVVERDVVVAAVVGDMLAGRSAVYADLVAYDEVAHHSGVERPETLEVLRRLDRCIALVAGVARYAPRPYEVVVLSDHGQSQGPTFAQAYGRTLEQLVREACGAAAPDPGHAAGRQPAGPDRGRGAEARTAAQLALYGREPAAEAAEPAAGEPLVLASGNLGLVYFRDVPHRLTLEDVEERHPGLVGALAGHPGVGFVLVRGAGRGPLAVGARGVRELATGAVEGEDPLAVFGGDAAAEAVARTDSFPHCADLMVNSSYDPVTGEVHAFEEQVGSHGGLGGGQGRPFLLHPASLRRPPGEPVGAEALHRLFAGWLAELREAPAGADGTRGAGGTDWTDVNAVAAPGQK
ncbi:alkaline phosphatase family protein [Streptacidiphilus sp. ASG 303]|uniref:alkaline phosphatase family protein n=1 Tax=Streptacidiphilus sp. ASG 303 TaxID=2896847 RepID=UPI001E60E27B|nr:alkaline phosphatase family protein [Streptacidiphilus sp. ASG 303]MCD0486374.1 alkaline phosphatase family protein [Streptacidiphilus sp. ASG 303]